MLSVDALFQSQTAAQVKATLYAVADSLGLSTTAWQKLSPLRATYAVLAQLLSNLTALQALANRSGFLDYAPVNSDGTASDLLKNVALYVYGVEARPATFAAGEVTVDNAAGGLYTFGVGDLVVVNTATQKAYRNTAAVTVNPLETGVAVAIEALEVGSASTSAPGQIDAFATAAPGLTVTNAASVVGEDEEQAADLIARCREKQAATSPDGPAKAFAYVAKTRTLNGGVPCDRVLVRPAVGDGTVRVVVAGPDGAIAGTTGDDTTDLGKLFVALNRWAVTSGYTLQLASASEVTITPNATLYVASSSGLSEAEAIAAAELALARYVPTIPIGGVDVGGGGAVLYRALEAVMKNSSSGVLQAKLAVETDTALAETEVAALGSFTLAVSWVDA